MSNDLITEDYTEKSFVVRGNDTRALKDSLRDLGGKYNANLKGGPGWIFSLKKRPEVEAAIKTLKVEEGVKVVSDARLAAQLIARQYLDTERKGPEVPRPPARAGIRGGSSVEERLSALESKLDEVLEGIASLRLKAGMGPLKVRSKSFNPVITEEEDEDPADEELQELQKPRPRLLKKLS